MFLKSAFIGFLYVVMIYRIHFLNQRLWGSNYTQRSLCSPGLLSPLYVIEVMPTTHVNEFLRSFSHQVPCYSYGQKLSKLAILRIACNYILSLAQLAELDYSSDDNSLSFSQCVEQCTRTLQAEGRSKKRKVTLHFRTEHSQQRESDVPDINPNFICFIIRLDYFLTGGLPVLDLLFIQTQNILHVNCLHEFSVLNNVHSINVTRATSESYQTAKMS